jgi:hypothetical protein
LVWRGVGGSGFLRNATIGFIVNEITPLGACIAERLSALNYTGNHSPSNSTTLPDERLAEAAK